MAIEDLDYLADYYGAGVWQFNTDRDFDQADRTTWPTPVHAGQRPGDQELPEHRVGLLRPGRPAAGQPHPQPRVALRLRQQPAQPRPDRRPAGRSAVRRAREHGDRRPRQRPQQPAAALRLRLGRAWRRRHGRARRPRPLLGPEPAVVQHPRRRRQQPVHRRGHRSQPAAVLSRPDRRAGRPHAGGLHPHRGRPGHLPARRRSQPAVRRQRHGRHRQDAAGRHLARDRLHPSGSAGPADRARRQPAGASDRSPATRGRTRSSRRSR